MSRLAPGHPVRRTAVISVVAALLPGAIAWLPAGAYRELAAAWAAALVAALIQVIATLIVAGRALGPLEADTDQGGRPAAIIVLAWFAAGALTGPSLLTAALAIAGIDLGPGLTHNLLAWFAVQGVMALALHRVLGGLAAASRRRPPATAGVQGQLLALLLPAAGVALALGWAGGQATRQQNIEVFVAGYSRLAEGVFETPPLPEAGVLRGLVETLTPFDEAAPFAMLEGGVMAGDLGPERREFLAGVVADRGGRVDLGTGKGLVWITPSGSVSVAGFRLSLAPDPGLLGLVASLVLASSLLAALLAMGLGSWLLQRLAARTAAIDSLPDGPLLPLFVALPRELARIDLAIHEIAGNEALTLAEAGDQATDQPATREKKAMVFAGMSHDLRSPLNSVVGFTDLLLKGMDGELKPDQRAAVSIIAEEAERLLVRIGDILDTARLDAGRFEIERAWVPSVEILTECATGAERLVASKDVVFESRLQPGLPPVLVDKSRIVQALLSLVARALESTGQGVIVLEARRLTGSGGLRVEISDPEKNVGPDHRRLIERAWGVARADWGSLGQAPAVDVELGPAALGLSLARRMVELHGGTVTATTGPDDRVLFAVTLPLDSEGIEA